MDRESGFRKRKFNNSTYEGDTGREQRGEAGNLELPRSLVNSPWTTHGQGMMGRGFSETEVI